MATELKPIARLAPSAATLSTLYTVPAATEVVVSTLFVCNRSATATSFRVAVRPLGTAIADNQYLYYDCAIGGNETFPITGGITLQPTDIVSVYATLATLSFNLFGQLNT